MGRRCLLLPSFGLRLLAALCYLGALRVPVAALAMPEWSLSVPAGLAVAGMAWCLGRRLSPFLLHHAREGLRWSIQANLLLAALALLSMLFHQLREQLGWSWGERLWHLAALVVQWTGVLVSILTLLVMSRALRGSTEDPFNLHRGGA
jgi:hypothetical protein